MEVVIFVLSLPLVGGAFLALYGHRDFAPELNVLFSAATFISACFLSLQVISQGPLIVLDQQFFLDSLRVPLRENPLMGEHPRVGNARLYRLAT